VTALSNLDADLASVNRAQDSWRWGVAALVSVVVLVLTYVLAVWTVGGQSLENAALRGADQVATEELAAAGEALGAITVVSLGVAIAVVALIALVRRRVDLAVAGVGLVVLGQVITQGLKRFVLPRPPLVDVVGDYAHNSFPSGHTTIAMTVLFAILIVVPYRWRGLSLLFVLPWAIGIGAYTVTAKWHRFSDTLGAAAVAMLCACLASWWLARRGTVTRYTGRPYRLRVVLVIVASMSTALALLLGALLWGIPMARGTDMAHAGPASEYTAYLGAHSLAAGFSGAAALVFWWLWHRRTTDPAPESTRKV
jgi:membrane-associated phospholipid phosphatase